MGIHSSLITPHILRTSPHSFFSNMSSTPADFHSQPFSYYLVFDVEATCEEGDRSRTFPHEIIEFPVVVLTANGDILPTPRFHAYLTPTENPILSEFCTSLTGITQEMVEGPDTLTYAQLWPALEAWLDEHGFFTPEKPTVFACDGPWDVRDFVQNECKRKGIEFPWYMNPWVDLRRAYKNHFDNGARGVVGMLDGIGLEFEGREHCGMDDAINIARLGQAMLRDNAILHVNRAVGKSISARLPFPTFDFSLISKFTADEVVAANPQAKPRFDAWLKEKAAAANARAAKNAARKAKRRKGRIR